MPIILRKQDPNEEILVGDVIMVSPETQNVTRAINDKTELNSRLVVGVCIESDNNTPLPQYIDGGNSKIESNIVTINGGDSTDNKIKLPINGGNSELRKREVVSVESNGIQVVNVVHHVDLGDKLTISRLHSGKAESIDTLNYNKFCSRTIGKVIKYTTNKEQVVCLLDIE